MSGGPTRARVEGLLAQAIELRVRAESFRGFGYFASADVLDDRADRKAGQAQRLQRRLPAGPVPALHAAQGDLL